ncbi:MAG TPA: Flp family type IVb pilin [Rhizomicrobium sp.]|nr:Flp family type IVb pilin [Rhizomicrobium sp.]
MRKFLGSYLRDESGAAAAEYALILAIIGVVIAAALLTLQGTITTAITNASNAIKNNTGS